MAEVIAATGARQHNLLERLKARGTTVRSRKEGRTTRYWAVPPAALSFELTVSSKGQLTLPKDLRDRLGVRRGGKLQATIEDDKIVVGRKTGSLKALVGILHRPGMHAVTIEEMDEGIRKAVTERYLRSAGRLK